MPENYSDRTKYPNIGDTLAAQGSRIGKFDQTVFNKYYDSVSGESINAGYCAGVTLDWIRRVLLSKIDRFDTNRSALTYHHEAIEDGSRTGTAAQEKARTTVLRAGQAYAKDYSGDSTRWKQPSNVLRQETWDAAMEQLDLASGKKKKFKSLTVQLSNTNTYTSSGTWRGALLGGATRGCVIPAGCAARVDFNLPNSTGHAVAIWRRRETTTQGDSFYLFDPNLGVFSYDADFLDVALSILFAYPANGDIPKYHNCASRNLTTMSYIVFGPANRVDAIVQRQPILTNQPVQTPVPVNQSATRPAQTSTPVTQPVQTSTQVTQPVNHPVQPSVPVNPTVQTQPQSPPNLYGTANRGVGQPGNTRSEPTTTVTVQPVTTSPSSGLGAKAEFQQCINDTNLHLDSFLSKRVQGGYVKLDANLAQKVREAGKKQRKIVFAEDAVKEQMKGNLTLYAISKAHLQQLVNVL